MLINDARYFQIIIMLKVSYSCFCFRPVRAIDLALVVAKSFQSVLHLKYECTVMYRRG